LSPLLVIFITVFLDLVGFGIIIPLSPFLSREFNADPVQIGWLMSIYSLMQFIFAPIWGRLSDRIGRRPIMLFSLFGGALSYLIFAFATSFSGLFIARLFAGICAANISTAMAYIADITHEKDRSKNMGLIGAAFGLGFIFGPVISGLSMEIGFKINSRPPFGMNFPALIASGLCFLNFLLAFKILKESLPPEKRGQAPARASRIKNALKHLSRPVVGPLILVFFLCGLGMAHMESNLFLYVSDIFNWSNKKASFGFAYVGIIMVITQGYLIRKLLPKWGERILLPMGLFMMVIGLAGIGISNSVGVLAVIMTILALGNGFTNPSVLGGISLMSDSREQGEVMGVTHSLASLARILGPPLGGWYYKHFSPSAPFFVAGIMVFVALIIVSLLISKIPNSGRQNH